MRIPTKSEITVEWAEKFSKFNDGVLEMVKERIKDKKVPLEDRWSIYISLHKLFHIQTWYITPTTLSKAGFQDTWYDDFYVDRYQTLLFDNDFIEKVKNLQQEDSTGFWAENVDIDALKEEILDIGLGGFINDW